MKKIQIVFCGRSNAAFKSATMEGADEYFLIKSEISNISDFKKLSNISEKLVDPYDLYQNYKHVSNLVSQYDNPEAKGWSKKPSIIINLTGASKIQTLSMFLLSHRIYLNTLEERSVKKTTREPVEFIYLPESEGKNYKLPLYSFFYLHELIMSFNPLSSRSRRGRPSSLKLKILEKLSNTESISLQELSSSLSVSKPTIARSISPLVNYHLINKQSKGRETFYEASKLYKDVFRYFVNERE